VNKTTTVAILSGVFLLLFCLEKLFPLRARTVALWRRIVVNLAVAGLALLTAGVIVRPAGDAALQWSSEKHFGLIQLLGMPTWFAAAAGFLLLDLSFYYWHRANHVVPLLWRFHNVHHIDGDLDVSTAFRFHLVEVALSAGFRVVQILLLGVSAWTYLVYELAFQTGTLFHHSNLRLPIGVERLLSRIFVTPRMHAIHHSQVQREAYSNYSTVFSWWDRLHRSLQLGVHQKDIVIGVPAYTGKEDRSFIDSLAIPFKKQKSYWTSSDGTQLNRQSPESRTRMLE
jgi:sterol desaturase/sphingolipid hydroxylase (fatty acid hydroxylase superfamily)